MSDRFTWTSDLTRGEWLRPMEDEAFGSILSIVPRGFDMYARVFHPVERDRPRTTQTWVGIDEETFFADVRDIEASLETQRATWAQTAASFGTTMHATAQYSRLVRREHGDSAGAIAPDGWRYGDTEEGCLDAASFAAVAAVLARHTATPGAGIAAVWDGWGGLTSSAGVFIFDADGPAHDMDEASKLAAEGAAFIPHPWPAPHQAEPGSGILTREAATGPHFDLHGDTGRHYVLFEAGPNDFADVSWPDHAPWVDDSPWTHSPSILWPDDHAWVLATEIDFDSTLIAGSAELIHELTQTPGLEVWPIRPDADLTWDGDELNGLDTTRRNTTFSS